MIPLSDYLIVSGLLFVLSMVGIVVNRKNLIALLMCIELMLLAINTNFLAFSHYMHQQAGELFVFFILTVAAAESAIALAIFVLWYRSTGGVSVTEMDRLKG